jgi:hypothetical protein
MAKPPPGQDDDDFADRFLRATEFDPRVKHDPSIGDILRWGSGKMAREKQRRLWFGTAVAGGAASLVVSTILGLVALLAKHWPR